MMMQSRMYAFDINEQRFLHEARLFLFIFSSANTFDWQATKQFSQLNLSFGTAVVQKRQLQFD